MQNNQANLNQVLRQQETNAGEGLALRILLSSMCFGLHIHVDFHWETLSPEEAAIKLQ